MTPDDPRHGTEAGYSAHGRAGEQPCEPCAAAKRRGDKRRRVYGAALVPVPQDVQAKLQQHGARTLVRVTGLSWCAIDNLQKKGAKARAKPETIAKLRAARVPTDIGTVRRIRALTRLGWSGPEIGNRSGVPYTTVVRLRDLENRTLIGRDSIRDAIADAYEQMSMTAPPLTRMTSRLVNKATRNGWAPPLAWDDIDDPDEQPQVGQDTPRGHNDVDHARVERVINDGERLHLTRAERVEVVRRLRDDRGWPEERIEHHTGIAKATDRRRYPPRHEEDAA